MFTRCPDCDAIYDVSVWQIAQAAGSVRCGRCHKKFQSLEQLFDHRPEPGEQAIEIADPVAIPVLGQELPAVEQDDYAAYDHWKVEPTAKVGWRLVWGTLLFVLIGTTLANIAVTFKEPLLAQAKIRQVAEYFDLVDPEAVELKADPSQIQMVNSDIQPHPTVGNALILRATLVNTATLRQAYPVLEITLFDLHRKPMGMRSFQPAEYLDAASDPALGFSPGVYLPVVLEMNDPGPEAVGFEIRFL
jgi:predicted Zn finger-like uncharacterized protein